MSGALALSWAGAVVACLGYGSASVLQSIGARRTAHVAGATGVAMIWLQVPYLAGLAVDVVAFAANVVALQELPLYLVQSVVTASVGVTAVIASIRGAKLGGRDWLSLGILGTGLVLLGLTASTESAVHISRLSEWIIFASAILPVTIGLIGLRLRERPAAFTCAFAAGLAFTGVAVSARGLSADRIDWSLLGHPLLWAIGLHGILATVFFAVALQRGAVTVVTAVTFVVEMIIPSILGLLLFHDEVSAGLGPLAVVGFLLAVVGTVSLLRFAE